MIKENFVFMSYSFIISHENYKNYSKLKLLYYMRDSDLNM
jgi:hypothetical protein